MKIVFLCGSLEPGCDGVGDYTRRLAGELIRQGHELGAIALNDFHITEQYTGFQDAEGVTLPILRLPSNILSKNRFEIAKCWIEDFNPIWLSLQFVPFAFHIKGLPFTLSDCLAELGRGRKWHIMFHELWVGMARDSSKKLIIWGWIQKQIIRSIISKLVPIVIHSHTQLYIKQVTKMGFKVKQLPLFSNIPVVSLASDIEVFTKKCESKKTLSFVVFGTVHPGAPIIKFSKEVVLYSQKHNVSTKLIMVGRSGAEQLYWAEIWKAAGLVVEELGEQSAQNVSNILKHASVGITTNPIFLVEKSGTVAAMCEHGLPVLSVSCSWFPRDIFDLHPVPGIAEYHPGNLEIYLESKLNKVFSTTLTEVANKFLKALLS